MSWRDLFHFALFSLAAHRLRSFLTLLGIAVGIAAVILLTSLGEGLHAYVLNEFAQFGGNIIKITPGRQNLRSGAPLFSSSARDLSMDDMAALSRLPVITNASPFVEGNAEIRANGRVRRTAALGVGGRMHEMFAVEIASGHFLPEGREARALAVLGATLKHELFGNANAIGARIEIGDERYRVIGVLQAKGYILGVDIDDAVYIPATRALALYNRTSMNYIMLSYNVGADADKALPLIRQTLTARHGREDFTITTEGEMISRLTNILSIITIAVSTFGSISLVVGAVGIVTIMTIAVTERTREIGLLVALGARRRTILGLFLAESVALAALGGLLGLLVGIGAAKLVGLFVPALPVSTPWMFALAAETLSALIGLAAGVLPARHAARLNVVDALRAE